MGVAGERSSSGTAGAVVEARAKTEARVASSPVGRPSSRGRRSRASRLEALQLGEVALARAAAQAQPRLDNPACVGVFVPLHARVETSRLVAGPLNQTIASVSSHDNAPHYAANNTLLQSAANLESASFNAPRTHVELADALHTPSVLCGGSESCPTSHNAPCGTAVQLRSLNLAHGHAFLRSNVHRLL